MTRTCTVCRHKHRDKIEHELVARVPYRDVSRQFEVSKDALSRHVREHLPATLALAHEAEEVEHAKKLLTDIEELQAQTLAMLEAARQNGDLNTALRAVDAARRNIELLMKSSGELDGRPVEANNYFIGEAVQVAIIDALVGNPAAKQAVADALARFE